MKWVRQGLASWWVVLGRGVQKTEWIQMAEQRSHSGVACLWAAVVYFVGYSGDRQTCVCVINENTNASLQRQFEIV